MTSRKLTPRHIVTQNVSQDSTAHGVCSTEEDGYMYYSRKRLALPAEVFDSRRACGKRESGGGFSLKILRQTPR